MTHSRLRSAAMRHSSPTAEPPHEQLAECATGISCPGERSISGGPQPGAYRSCSSVASTQRLRSEHSDSSPSSASALSVGLPVVISQPCRP
jgi:hypothetical protein